MKNILYVLLFISSCSFGQLTIEIALDSAYNLELGSYDYHQKFTGHTGYAAPLILTSDGGAAVFGDSEVDEERIGKLVKMDKTGREEWALVIHPEFDEIESQSVIQDRDGNYYIFMLSYDYKRFRGGSERVIYLDGEGKIIWDKTFGEYSTLNSPAYSYIKLLDDGRISLRGHVVNEKPGEGKDPVYRYWEGWLNCSGEITQKAGDVIDWAKQDWQKWYEPE